MPLSPSPCRVRSRVNASPANLKIRFHKRSILRSSAGAFYWPNMVGSRRQRRPAGAFFRRGQPPRAQSRVEKAGEGSAGLNGDFPAQLTFGWKENGHRGRRQKPGWTPPFSQVTVRVTGGAPTSKL